MFRRCIKEEKATFADASFSWMFGSLCQLFRIPFDARLVAQAFPPPYDALNLQCALGDLGIRCAMRAADARQLARLP